QRIRQVLMERHPTDGRDWWRALGPETPDVILSLYPETRNVNHRVRLVQALTWFPEHDGAARFLKEQAEAKANNPVLRRAAVKSVAISRGEREVEFLSKFLKEED